MALSKSPKSLEERVAANAEIKAEKKREQRLQQKRDAEQRRRERKRADEEQRKADDRNVEHFAGGKWFEHRGLRTIGEIASGVDVRNLNEALLIANLWCGLLGLALDPNETILEREIRVAEEYCKQGSPWLAADGTLTLHSEDCKPFDPATWVGLAGADTTRAGVPGDDIQSGPPKFIPTLAPKRRKPAPETIPDGTGDSSDVGVLPSDLGSGSSCMTFLEERVLAARRELEQGQQDRLRAQAQLQDAPIAIFESEVGITN